MEDVSVEKQIVTANGYAATAASYIFRSAGNFLYKLGAVGAATHAVSRYAIGYAVVHPAFFMTAILSSVAVSYGADSLQKASLESHIEVITEHFAKVTSNLMNQYFKTSEIVSDSFLEKNPLKVHSAISGLIDG